MRVLAVFAAVLSVPIICSTLATASSHAAGRAGVARAEKHRRLAEAASSDEHNATLTKRGSSRFTWYDDTGAQVACGGWYTNNDFIVALNIEVCWV
ncbi:hypothetical protein NM688_g2923 [Phlebia brevispora]|uniref:Uncharacterized protein n=1 Tax=Phlebia brevispora TaxID=194682 RepID=A0ACC1T7C6_9APHY|nr:hypothetical protein NM688_g2923 [Phlebia brevispora]